MLSTILVEYPWLTSAAFFMLVLLGPIAGAWLVPRPFVTRMALALSIVTLTLLTLIPTTRAPSVGCAIEWALPSFGAVELMANVILFAPVALVAGIATKRPLVALLIASGAAAAIEVVQAIIPALGRSCSTNDWLSNTLGAALGALLAVAAMRLARRSGGESAMSRP